MGGIEIAAALLGVTNVLLVVRRSIWNYPFGIAMVALYFFVFWEAKLYSDALLQIFFFLIQLYGCCAWVHAERVDHGVAVGWLSNRSRMRWLAGTAVATILWGAGMARFTDAVAPFADATVAGLSVSAQILQSFRRVESWVLWILIDVIATYMYFIKGIKFVALEYLVFCFIASFGLWNWIREYRSYKAV